MIDKCVDIMAQQEIMPETQARAVMTEVLPKLKRWQTTSSVELVTQPEMCVELMRKFAELQIPTV